MKNKWEVFSNTILFYALSKVLPIQLKLFLYILGRPTYLFVYHYQFKTRVKIFPGGVDILLFIPIE